MPDYQSNRFPRKPFNKGGSDRFGGPKTMYKASCATCGKSCEVPFRPNGKKPVFCADCFVRDDSAPRPSYDNKREFSPRPSFGRDAAPRPSFNRDAAPRDDRSMQDVKSELHGINEKLERLISLLAPATSKEVSKETSPETLKKKMVAKKVAAKKKTAAKKK